MQLNLVIFREKEKKITYFIYVENISIVIQKDL